ncbi:MAG: AAA family ATPase [Candidatus Competibacter denitrificans]
MYLSLNKPYISIKTFLTPTESLPKLIVITGLNGCGKTHLLKAIEKGHVTAHNDQGKAVTRIKFFNYQSLELKDEVIQPNDLTREKQTFWNQINSIASGQKEQALKQLTDIPDQPLAEEDLQILYEHLADHLTRNDDLSSLNETYRKAIDIKNQCLAAIKSHISNHLTTAAAQQPSNPDGIVGTTIKNRGASVEDILDRLQQKTPLPLFLLDWPTFENLYEPFIAYDPFQRSYSMWFSRYLEEWRRNRDNRDNFEKLGHSDTKFKTDEEFIGLHGRFPWEEIRSFFKEINLPFSISAPKAGDSNPFKAVITDQDGNIIEFGHFSSGENILLSLISALSYAKERDKLTTLPELLLLDEIDAPLHPAMTDFLLKTLNNTFVKRQDISVILTTHSPSTVAMAPEESLYELIKDGSVKKLIKISKDTAISRLTAGVPTLSVAYENRRLVLVESKYDAEYYTELDSLVRRYFSHNSDEFSHDQISLIFHSAGGSQRGGSDLVKEHTSQFRKSGLSTVYGVIDWDKRNTSNNSIFVLGENQGYSIETFLLDPLIVACLLLHDDIVPYDLSFTSIISANEVTKLEQEKKQALIDQLLNFIAPNQGKSENPILREYAGHFTLQLPRWFCYHEDGSNGHDLENLYLEKIPQLKKFGNELKSACIKRVLKNYSDLIPSAFIDLLQKLRCHF